MTIHSLFNIVLKILGILVLKDILTITPQLLTVYVYITNSDNIGEAIWTILSTLLLFSIYVVTSYLLIFRTNFLIQKLRLDKGFEQTDLQLNIHRSTILSISVIIIGGLILAQEIPNFCKLLFAYFQEKRMTNGMTQPNISYSVLAGAKILVGLLLIGNQRQIVNFIEWKRKS